MLSCSETTPSYLNYNFTGAALLPSGDGDKFKHNYYYKLFFARRNGPTHDGMWKQHLWYYALFLSLSRTMMSFDIIIILLS